MIEVKQCPICGASSFKKIFEAPYFRGDSQLFAVVECKECSLWITSPRPADKELAQYYNTGEYISHSNKKDSAIDYLYHWVRAYSLRKKLGLINSLVPSKGKLLDYGAGTGHFLKFAKDNAWEVSGVEPSEEARKVCLHNNNLILSAPDQHEFESNQYDVISLWHVLEHLPKLNQHLEQFSFSLKKGGFLIIAVPNHESWDAKHYGRNWAALDVPLHLYHFKKRNIRDLGNKHGLEVFQIKNMPFDSFYVSMLSEKIKSGKSSLLSAVANGLTSNLKGKSDKNMSSLIYVLQKAS